MKVCDFIGEINGDQYDQHYRWLKWYSDMVDLASELQQACTEIGLCPTLIKISH